MAPTGFDENRACSCAVVSGSSAEAQYLSVMPSQPLVTLKLTDLVVVDFLVAVFLQALVAEIADQAFMQDVIALDMRCAVPRDQRERIQRDRRIADIGDVILDA